MQSSQQVTVEIDRSKANVSDVRLPDIEPPQDGESPYQRHQQAPRMENNEDQNKNLSRTAYPYICSEMVEEHINDPSSCT